MSRLLSGVILAAAVGAAVVLLRTPTPEEPPISVAAVPSHPLVWDATEKTLDAKPEDAAAEFEFSVTNRSDRAVTVYELRPSCGCTTVEMPGNPWVLQPGAKGSFRATMDFLGKHGKFSRTISVHSPPGTQILSITVNIPEPDPATRMRNQQLAAANRQAVFKGDCASCHVAPIGKKMGGELFQAACAICHLASPRAEIVADLLTAKTPRDAEFWRKWIADGREGTLMPGFAEKHGGPLSTTQIESLVEYAVREFPTQPEAQAK